MPTQTRSSGLRVTMPDALTLVETAAPAHLPGLRRGPAPAAPAPDADLVVAALQAQEMQLVDEFALEAPVVPVGAARRGPAEALATPGAIAEIELDLEPHEDAVVLLEQEGCYEWKLPFSGGPTAAAARTRAEVSEPPASIGPAMAPGGRRTARFEIPVAATPPEAMPPTGARRGVIGDWVKDQIKAYVFKYTARLVAGVALSFLERNVQRGLVVMDTNDPSQWRRVEDLGAVRLPEDRVPRILLFIHGTFSSTAGSFGALGATPWGRALLEGARASYDAVIGFDHPTLSEDPRVNASDLLGRLLPKPAVAPPRFDVVTFSRGGLVFRCLAEELLPGLSPRPEIGRVIFVASTLSGTQLAKPENWHKFVDIYTNLAAGAARALKLFPSVHAKAAAAILSGTIESIGAFVKFLATAAVTERRIPGLAAMEPDGPFVTHLNLRQTGQPTVEGCWYAAITSEFQQSAVLSGDIQELPRRFAVKLTDYLVDQLLGEANDLVVHTESMTRIDPQLGKFIKDALDFGPNPRVYHLNYFTRPEVANALARWLRLAAPVDPHGVAPSATGGIPRGVSQGAVVAPEAMAAVDIDVLELQGDMIAAEALERITRKQPSYVVVNRWHRGEILRYAFPAEEVLRDTSDPARSQVNLVDSMNLHEHECSREVSVIAPVVPSGPISRPTAARGVVVDNGRTVGVVPEPKTPLSLGALADIASRVEKPQSDDDRILARRVLPTFARRAVPPMETSATYPFVMGGAPRTEGRRSGPSAPQPPPAPPVVPAKVTCRFRAELESPVVLNEKTSVTVTVSREMLGQWLASVAAEAEVQVDPNQVIVLQLVPRLNVETVGESRVEIQPPAANSPLTLLFDFRAVHPSEGELWIVARQGGVVPLVTLRLRFPIVTSRQGSARMLSADAAPAPVAMPQEPLVQLRISERYLGDNTFFYRFELFSPQHGIRTLGESKAIKGNRQAYVDKLYEEIERRWVTSQADAEAFNRELRSYGGSLLDELVPQDVQAKLWEYRTKFSSIQVLSEEPFIPWEIVHLKEPGKRILPAESWHLGQLGLVRWLDLGGDNANAWPTEKLVVRRGRAFYVVPDYPDDRYKLPQAALEPPFLKEKFWAESVTPDSNAFARKIEPPSQFDLLHFAGHGDAQIGNVLQARLLLQGRVEAGQYVPDYFNATTVEQTAELMDGEGHRPIVVLNACRAGRLGYRLAGVGGFAEAFIRAGAGLFIGAHWSVGDQPARHFTEAFYSALLQGKNLASATIAARVAARNAGEATWLAYAVYGHPHATLRLA